MIDALTAATTRREAVGQLAGLFAECGVEQPEREARLTICAACGLTAVDLIARPDGRLDDTAAALRTFASRRASREPLSRIVGHREFWGLDIAIAPCVLDPRPETETLIEAALTTFADRRDEPLRILDLGVGSGALIAALLSEFRRARGVGVDLSGEAAEVARANLERLGLASRAKICVGSWTAPVAGSFDLIVSNPPYIRSSDIAGLAPEVRDHDSRLALDGGPDGFDAYRALVPKAALRLLPGGSLMVEVGVGQAGAVLALALGAGLVEGRTWRDLAGIERAVLARARNS